MSLGDHITARFFCQTSGVTDIIAVTKESKICWADTLLILFTTGGCLMLPSGIRGKENDQSVDLHGDGESY